MARLDKIPVEVLCISVAQYLDTRELSCIIATKKEHYNLFKNILDDRRIYEYSVALKHSEPEKINRIIIMNDVCINNYNLKIFVNLEILTFDKNFNNKNKPIKKNIFPEKLKKLSFGHSFNNGENKLKYGVLPESLEELDFGSSFDNGQAEMKILPKKQSKRIQPQR